MENPTPSLIHVRRELRPVRLSDEGLREFIPSVASPTDGQPLLLRPSEAAVLLGLERTKVYDLARQGRLPAITSGRTLRIPTRALLEWIAQQTTSPVSSSERLDSAAESLPGRHLAFRPKRRHGKGSIYRRSADGLWCGAIRTATLQKVVYAKTRRQVARKLAAAMAALRAGTLVPVRPPTLSDFLNQWLAESVKPRVSPLTYSSYEINVRKHINPSLGAIRMDQLGPEHVQRFMNAKLNEGLAAKSVTYMRQVLRTALNQATRWSLVTRNVATLVDAPRKERYQIHPLDPTEAKEFLRSISSHPMRALFMLALALGLRQGEVLGLRWQDVDLDRGVLRVRYQLQRIEGKLQLVEPKTESSRRSLALPRSLVEALRGRQLRQAEERRLAGTDWNESGLVFSSRIGAPLQATNVILAFRKALEDAGLPRRRFHDLRHSCATLLLVQGVSPRVVMEILGHSEIAMTMNTYTHVVPELRREAANRMEELLRD